ncbi:class I SAM-dependent methyltransferase [Vibrio viridaestus]|uniref:Methyltransferase domain-containing protein n=1 Tax=Vibrio viridaestus TaxID=2487322 RepID=A0A3N9U1P9_9VIBR|nr:class I SAM-dependent methyltransferase [Vibrio viridaestus]RQW63432.1 methyltransferase domain-containing protein [Vibrio viridaestus]
MKVESIRTLINEIEIQLEHSSDEVKRLFHGRGRCWEGLEQVTVDWIDRQLVVALYKEPAADFVSELKSELFALSDKPVWKQAGGLTVLIQYRYVQGAETEVVFGNVEWEPIVTEHGLKFQMSLGRNQNSGLFLDMKNGRQWVKEHSENKRVLNLFAYTCGFSVAAVAGGADLVVNVDMAKHSLSTGRDNHRLNAHDLSKVKFLAHDIFKSWGKIKKSGPYDIVIIDPPSFQKGSFALTSDYKKILRRLPELVAEDGMIMACVNSPAVSSRFLVEQMAEHAPQYTFHERLDNPKEFPDDDKEAGLKVMLFQ